MTLLFRNQCKIVKIVALYTKKPTFKSQVLGFSNISPWLFFYLKIKIWREISLLSIYLEKKNKKTLSWKDACTPMFTAALYMIAKVWSNLNVHHQKNIYYYAKISTMPKPLTVWTTTNSRKFLKRWEYQTTWPASSEICMQVKKQQLELYLEQQTGSK